MGQSCVVARDRNIQLGRLCVDANRRALEQDDHERMKRVGRQRRHWPRAARLLTLSDPSIVALGVVGPGSQRRSTSRTIQPLCGVKGYRRVAANQELEPPVFGILGRKSRFHGHSVLGAAFSG